MAAPYIEPLTVEVASLPQRLEGLRLLHISDVHVRARWSRRRHEAILRSVEISEHDLLLITGDLMCGPGDEPAAAQFVTRLARAARPKFGALGVWGNHDSPELRSRLEHVPVRWLSNQAWASHDLPLSVLGLECGPDDHHGWTGDLPVALLGEAQQCPDDRPRFRLLLSHSPAWLPAAAATGVGLMLCGHTHAGQCRLPTRHILYNATPRWPLRLSCGVLRYGRTRCVISRGLGEVYVQGLRLFCRPHIPLITLRRADHDERPVGRIQCIQGW